MDKLFQIRKPLPRTLQLTISLVAVVIFFAVWSILSYGGFVTPLILPTPDSVLTAIPHLHFKEALLRSVFASFYRVFMGFLLAAIVAIPMGIIAGTFPFFKACIQPFMGPLRYLPIGAVIPLFIVWFGIDEEMKIMVLFVGTVVYLLPLIVETVENLDDVYLQTAYTLGATKAQIIQSVIVPGSMPAVFEALRVLSGIGWTYVILAEIVNAKYGLGHLISVAARRSHTDQVIAAVLIILVIGVLTDKLFVFLNRTLFSWKEEQKHGH